MKIQEIFFSF
uniref:Uncharacterized protein n=1 Tax=Arundo donax TaxID=35708 RepID=A0A0A9GC69_ARUDO